MPETRYSQEEIKAILGRAIEREHGGGELSHSDLLSAAHEVGISTDALEGAAAEVLAERRQTGQLVQLRRQQWRGFLRHLVPYLVVNGMLVTLNLLTTHFPWSLFPVFGWGIGLLFHFIAVVAPNPERLERRLERQRERERRRQVRQRIRDNANQLEKDLGEGISTLLQAAAQRVAGNSSYGPNPGQNRQRVVDNGPSRKDSGNDSIDDVDGENDPNRRRGGTHHR